MPNSVIKSKINKVARCNVSQASGNMITSLIIQVVAPFFIETPKPTFVYKELWFKG
jgi:hypothetical protein